MAKGKALRIPIGRFFARCESDYVCYKSARLGDPAGGGMRRTSKSNLFSLDGWVSAHACGSWSTLTANQPGKLQLPAIQNTSGAVLTARHRNDLRFATAQCT